MIRWSVGTTLGASALAAKFVNRVAAISGSTLCHRGQRGVSESASRSIAPRPIRKAQRHLLRFDSERTPGAVR
jgi:hypothetical protein